MRVVLEDEARLKAQISEVVYYSSEGMSEGSGHGAIESFGEAVRGVYVSFDEASGSLILSFGEGRSDKVETLVSDALVLVNLSGDRVTDLEILFDDKNAVRRLAKARFRSR